MRNREKIRPHGVNRAPANRCIGARSTRLARCSFATALTALLGGCGPLPPIILSSNVDRYNDGTSLELVGPSIPGAPDGDFIQNVIPSVSVTTGGTDLMSGHKVQVSGGRIDYRTADHDVPDTYVITWRGMREQRTSTAQTTIRFQDAAGRLALVVRLRQASFAVDEGDDAAIPEPTYSDQFPHDVQVTIDMTGGKGFWVRATEGGAILFDSPRLELIDDEFSSLHTIQIESEEPAPYFLQELRASTEN